MVIFSKQSQRQSLPRTKIGFQLCLSLGRLSARHKLRLRNSNTSSNGSINLSSRLTSVNKELLSDGDLLEAVREYGRLSARHKLRLRNSTIHFSTPSLISRDCLMTFKSTGILFWYEAAIVVESDDSIIFSKEDIRAAMPLTRAGYLFKRLHQVGLHAVHAVPGNHNLAVLREASDAAETSRNEDGKRRSCFSGPRRKVRR
jgi:hypothetical protein